jgi:hypothetical protein
MGTGLHGSGAVQFWVKPTEAVGAAEEAHRRWLGGRSEQVRGAITKSQLSVFINHKKQLYGRSWSSFVTKLSLKRGNGSVWYSWFFSERPQSLAPTCFWHQSLRCRRRAKSAGGMGVKCIVRLISLSILRELPFLLFQKSLTSRQSLLILEGSPLPNSMQG